MTCAEQDISQLKNKPVSAFWQTKYVAETLFLKKTDLSLACLNSNFLLFFDRHLL